MIEMQIKAWRERFLPEQPLPTGMFEETCRAAATRMGVPEFCRMRRCRRDGYCIGPTETRMIPVEFCGEAPISALLPRCAARADDEWLASLILEWQVVRLDHFGDPPIRPPEAVRQREGLPAGHPVALDFAMAATDLTDSD